ncbi:hypothetical protein CEXT_625091 [Caerostris extrusa]|uniref:Uncharacterized protein n=1 Tax=Caerostris extrusa TaxID=172846 RepID=A0AAV4XTS8_CAEEX|nr:hypothetical protein CEXT_625091 [Caerostris extrusa]
MADLPPSSLLLPPPQRSPSLCPAREQHSFYIKKIHERGGSTLSEQRLNIGGCQRERMAVHLGREVCKLSLMGGLGSQPRYLAWL